MPSLSKDIWECQEHCVGKKSERKTVREFNDKSVDTKFQNVRHTRSSYRKALTWLIYNTAFEKWYESTFPMMDRYSPFPGDIT